MPKTPPPPMPRDDETSGPLGEAISVRLPAIVDAKIRSLPNRTEWLRNLIIEAAKTIED